MQYHKVPSSNLMAKLAPGKRILVLRIAQHDLILQSVCSAVFRQPESDWVHTQRPATQPARSATFGTQERSSMSDR